MAKFIYIYDNDQLLQVLNKEPYETLLIQGDTKTLVNTLKSLKTANTNKIADIQTVINSGPSAQMITFLQGLQTYLNNVNGQVDVFIADMKSRANNVATAKAIFVGTPAAAKEYFDLKGIDYTNFIP